MKIILNLVEAPFSQKRLRQVWQHWGEVGKVVDVSTRPVICRNFSSAAQDPLIRALSTETFSNVIQLHLSKLCVRNEISPPGTLVGSQERATFYALREIIYH